MALKVNTPMPSIEGPTCWLNSEVSADELRGHPVLVHFWAVSCPACMHNMKSLQAWKEQYEPQGLRLVAVHLPRMSVDRELELVEAVVQKHGITWPCAVDSESVLGERFETGVAWPYYFLFDAEGKMRTRAAGGVGLRLLENSLNRLQSSDSTLVVR